MDEQAELYIGLMSGTSMDGVDAVQVDYAAGKATVGSSRGRLPLDAAVLETISSAGYRGSVIAGSEPG